VDPTGNRQNLCHCTALLKRQPRRLHVPGSHRLLQFQHLPAMTPRSCVPRGAITPDLLATWTREGEVFSAHAPYHLPEQAQLPVVGRQNGGTCDIAALKQQRHCPAANYVWSWHRLQTMAFAKRIAERAAGAPDSLLCFRRIAKGFAGAASRVRILCSVRCLFIAVFTWHKSNWQPGHWPRESLRVHQYWLAAKHFSDSKRRYRLSRRLHLWRWPLTGRNARLQQRPIERTGRKICNALVHAVLRVEQQRLHTCRCRQCSAGDDLGRMLRRSVSRVLYRQFDSP